jgi:hypothetical protein
LKEYILYFIKDVFFLFLVCIINVLFGGTKRVKGRRYGCDEDAKVVRWFQQKSSDCGGNS